MKKFCLLKDQLFAEVNEEQTIKFCSWTIGMFLFLLKSLEVIDSMTWKEHSSDSFNTLDEYKLFVHGCRNVFTRETQSQKAKMLWETPLRVHVSSCIFIERRIPMNHLSHICIELGAKVMLYFSLHQIRSILKVKRSKRLIYIFI
jgi:hypothetical protein